MLVSGGTFIFDLNTRKGLTRWNGVIVHPGDDIFYVNRSIYDEITIRAWTKITGFVRDDAGRYDRFDETVYNTVFELEAVHQLLSETGFHQIYCATGSDLTNPIDDPENEGRIFFVAQK